MSSTIKMLQTHHEKIHNTFITQYSNGPLEGPDNKIKAIKRASFGYRSFFSFRTRVLYFSNPYKKSSNHKVIRTFISGFTNNS
ncbi:transposase [Liquorilactobacillus capillatus]|uniref:transposase n=1 Tax=Liquorilactobacillus capillatus TaxID=480931 RepID=UPI001F263BB3|nr:transposase [Liquorilactobacillus capillatus]